MFLPPYYLDLFTEGNVVNSNKNLLRVCSYFHCPAEAIVHHLIDSDSPNRGTAEFT